MKKPKAKAPRLKRLISVFVIIIFFSIFLYFENNSITTTNIVLETDNLPKSFNNYKIVHLSDLHGKSFGINQQRLVEKIKKAEPDIILFTGDLVDARRYEEKHSIELMKQITQMADVYYVTGNHEWSSLRYSSLEETLLGMGVKVLRNTSQAIKRGKEEIYIIGIDDPLSGYKIAGEGKSIGEAIELAQVNIRSKDTFKVLLSHRPEFFTLYSQYDFDLVFSGHAHGGQFRLPFVGGLVAPGQGILPKYFEGAHGENNSTMIVSRGLGNSLFPQRLFNRPEIIVVRLIEKEE